MSRDERDKPGGHAVRHPGLLDCRCCEALDLREDRAVRDLARRVDPMGRVQWVRTDGVSVVRTDAGPRLEYRLTASRLDPSYR